MSETPAPIIDAEFEVITPAREPVRWSWQVKGLVVAYYAVTWGIWLAGIIGIALFNRWAYPILMHWLGA